MEKSQLKAFYDGISAFSKVKKISYTDKSNHKSQMLEKEKNLWQLDSMKLVVESQLKIQTFYFDHLTRWQSHTVHGVVEPSRRGSTSRIR